MAGAEDHVDTLPDGYQELHEKFMDHLVAVAL